MKYLLLATFLAAPASASPAAALRITLYNHARVPAHILEAASGDLRRIFRPSGIEITIIQGDPKAAESVLMTYPETPRRGLKQEAACRARRDVAVRITFAAPGQPSTILGMALPLARKGLNVVVYDDRVRGVAANRVRSHAAVLAYTTAHEIGHVLLRSNSHDRTGIMSGAWSDEEFAWIARETLIFSRQHFQAMRATLEGFGCADPGN